MGEHIKTDQDLLQYNKNILRKEDPSNEILKVPNEGKPCAMCGELFKAVGNTKICDYCKQDFTAQTLYKENRRTPLTKNRVGTLRCSILGQNNATKKFEIECDYILQEEKCKYIKHNINSFNELRNNFRQYLDDKIKVNELYLTPGNKKWPIYIKTCNCGCKSSFLTTNNSHKYKPSCYTLREKKRLKNYHKIKKDLRIMTKKEFEMSGGLGGYGPVGSKGTIDISPHRKKSDEEEMKDISRIKKRLGLK